MMEVRRGRFSEEQNTHPDAPFGEGEGRNRFGRLAQAFRCCSCSCSCRGGGGEVKEDEARMFSYKELSRATDAFDKKNLVGEGGFGAVYRGVLPDGTSIAAKRIRANSSQGMKEFVSELRTVGRIGKMRHRHLVALLGWCQHNGGMIIVYEFLAGGSLDKVLHQRKTSPLTFPQRISILRDVASALSFLHHGWLHGVVHRDVKSSNILLDDRLTAKLGDFGLAQQFNHGNTAVASSTAGTRGYLAPEAICSLGNICDKLDVYSFGALALEVACGRPPVDASLPPQQAVLLEWVWRFKEADRLKDVVDKRLGGEFDEEEMIRVLHVGLLCTHLDAKQRPSMLDVVRFLDGTMELPPVPKSRPRLGFSNLDTGLVALPLPPPPPLLSIEPGV